MSTTPAGTEMWATMPTMTGTETPTARRTFVTPAVRTRTGATVPATVATGTGVRGDLRTAETVEIFKRGNPLLQWCFIVTHNGSIHLKPLITMLQWINEIKRHCRLG
jgi:hypothetical protein